MTDGKDLIYYRTDGHTSSWTYRMTADNGRSSGPKNDVTDLDLAGDSIGHRTRQNTQS